MLRFTFTFGALVLLASCVAPSDGQRSATRPAGMRVPPPTQVQFFPSPRPVQVWRGQKDGYFEADLRFQVVDGAGTVDFFGDDDQTLRTDVSLSAGQSATITVRQPSHRPSNDVPNPWVDVDVNDDYRTTHLWFTARVGGNYPAEPIEIVVDDMANDDMYQRMEVRFSSLEGGGTRMSVTVWIRRGPDSTYTKTGSADIDP